MGGAEVVAACTCTCIVSMYRHHHPQSSCCCCVMLLPILGRRSGVSACARFVVRFVGHHSRRRPLVLSSSSLSLALLFLGRRGRSCCAPHSHCSPARGRRTECRHAGHAIFSLPFQILIKHWLRKRLTALLSSSSLLVLSMAAAAIIFCSKTKRETLGLRFILSLSLTAPFPLMLTLCVDVDMELPPG